MIGRLVFVLALALGVGAASAQEPCTLYKVNRDSLPISQGLDEVGIGRIFDALEIRSVACVTKKQQYNGRDWGFVSHKRERGNANTTVEGWTSLQYLQEISAADADALLRGAAPPAAAPVAPPPAASATPAPATPAPVAAVAAEDVLRFDQPVPFGPYPVNGRTIKELAESIPLFSPIEGAPESVWKMNCTACHKWDRETLCQQGTSYVKRVRDVLRHQHPFGGAYKLALMRWAKSGCQ